MLATPPRVSVPVTLLKLPVMSFWVTKFSVSPPIKPLATAIVAPVRSPPLSASVTAMPLSSTTGPPPPVKLAVAPAAMDGAT